MPSIGHVAVGLAGARRLEEGGGRGAAAARALVLTGLATFPDLDLLLPALGAGPVWAHRGALHSLAVAVAAALLGTWLLRAAGRAGALRTFAVACATAASHGLLDCITYGGGGVMLLWPLSTARLLAPWHPLPASPLALGTSSPRGLAVLLLEAVLFSPLVAYALWPRRAPGAAARAREGPQERAT